MTAPDDGSAGWREAPPPPPAASVRSTCPYCGVGCGIIARPDGSPNGVIIGDPEHPANRGRLCAKGAALAETLAETDRLRQPLIHGQPASWDAAIDLMGARFGAAIAQHGPDSVALYVSGQCLTEDYYVANKLMKGFIGSANIDTNSRLCMASSVAGHTRAFGADIVPGIYEDFEEADLVVLVGSNLAWCHPVLYQRLQAARARRGTKLVLVDPRRTASCEGADLHLPLAPGSDVSLFAGLLRHLHASGSFDAAWTAAHTTGLDAALAAAQRTPDATGLPAADLATFYRWFAQTPRVMTVYSQGVNQSAAGTDKVNAIINCHLATGRIGTPGAGPFSVTGQPNAMGGREVGGLANQLAAHMRFDRAEDLDRVRRFWQAPNLATRPGLKAVELFDAVHAGRIKALWVIATNPADSLPRAGHVREALARCPFLVVSDCWPTDTTRHAHVLLPAAGWGEKDGTVTNSERRISRQRPFRPAPGQARADWWALAQLGQRLGHREAFAWANPAAIFREHAGLSAFENRGSRPFDLGALAGLSDAGYDSLAPCQWPLPADGPAGGRLFAAGGFPTPDGRARCVATPLRGLAATPDADFPLLLNTGRTRDQWHTMTRTGLAPRLMQHAEAPAAAIAPEDAARLGLAPGDLVRLESRHGATTLPAGIEPGQRPGEVFVPMHWTDAFASAGPIDRLVTDATDPVSGQPELKATPIRASRVPVRWRGLLLHRRAVRPAAPDVAWSRLPLAAGHALDLAGTAPLPEPAALPALARTLAAASPDAEWLELLDPRRGNFRFAALVEGRVEACLFLAAGPAARLPGRDALAALLDAPVTDAARAGLLAGRAAAAAPADRTVCVCFSVGFATLRRAILDQSLSNVTEIGQALRAGTNCGSCIPELKELLRDASAPVAA